MHQHPAEENMTTAAFAAPVLARLLHISSACIRISTSQRIFLPVLKAYGIQHERVLFVHAQCERDALWVMVEASKCQGRTAVGGETNNIDFKPSSRLQLAT